MPKHRYECDQCGEFVAYKDEVGDQPRCPQCGGLSRWLPPSNVGTIYEAWGFSRTNKALKADSQRVSRKERERALEPEKGYKSD